LYRYNLVVFNALIHDNKRNRVQSPQFKAGLYKFRVYGLWFRVHGSWFRV
jgi:hypothetical protein